MPPDTNIGSSKAPNLGTDALLDLLSIGTPTQSTSPTIDNLTPSKDRKSPLAVLDLDTLSSPSISAKASSPAGSGSLMDLLDVASPVQPSPGKKISIYKKTSST